MNTKPISEEIVTSARVLGQWLNTTAYFVANEEVKADAPDRNKKIRKEKAKILVEFESAAMSAKSAVDMLYRISTRAGRLLQSDAPAESAPFMDAAASGVKLTFDDARYLLIAYSRLRAARIKEPITDNSPEEKQVAVSGD
jgi:hypothetical protein